MRNKRLNIASVFVVVAAIFMFTHSCTHKDLCYYHPHVAPVKVRVDWEKANGNEVDGMTARLFALQEQNQTINTTVTTHQINEIAFDLLEGNYSVAVFNNTPEEFATLKFYDLADYNVASVQVSETSVPWYSKYNVKSNDKFVAHQPEWVARGLSTNITVTKEMVENAEIEYIEGGYTMSARTVTLVDEVVPDSLICTFTIKVSVKGVDNFYQARAVVSGLAIGKEIISTEPLNESVSHYAGLEDWKLVSGSLSSSGIGEIEGMVHCFGLPRGHRGLPEDNLLTLEILLVDKQTIITSEPIPIGHLITKNTLGNLIMTESILFPKELPYVKPEDGKEGGFGIEFEDWEEEEIEILNH